MTKVQNFTAVLLILSLFAILIPKTAFADDSWVEVYGGAAQMRDGKGSGISMSSETVEITLERDTYTIDASFAFFNYGKTSTISVGFPETGSYGRVGHLQDFRTWVNGKRVGVKEFSCVVLVGDTEYSREKIAYDPEFEPMEETRWLVKNVTFPENAKTVTRVRYSAPYGIMAGPEYADQRYVGFVTYVYGSGRSWKGMIEKATFIIKSSPDTWMYSHPYGMDKGEFQFSRLGENEWEYVLTNFEPEKEDSFYFEVSSKIMPWDYRSYYRSNKYKYEFCADWDFSKQLIPDDFLEILSSYQLRLLRNALYARHGRIFKSKDLTEFFKKYKCYQPDPNFDESRLNEIEKANIEKISGYEKELKKLNQNRKKE